MSTATHTRGPWAWRTFGGGLSLHGDHGPRPVVLVADLDNSVGDWDPPGRPVILTRCRETGRLVPLTAEHPDARLIAAAPDLLSALETAVRWLRRLEREYEGCLNEDAIERHLMGAIAKAKGVTS